MGLFFDFFSQPEATAARWAKLLDLPAGPILSLDDGQKITFEAGDGGLTDGHSGRSLRPIG